MPSFETARRIASVKNNGAKTIGQIYKEESDWLMDQTFLNDIHKLLLYKDNKIEEKIFDSDEDYIKFFTNTLFRFGGLNELLGEPTQMVSLMSTLQAAYDEVQSSTFRYKTFRRAILDCHGYIKSMFELDEEV